MVAQSPSAQIKCLLKKGLSRMLRAKDAHLIFGGNWGNYREGLPSGIVLSLVTIMKLTKPSLDGLT